MRLERSINNRLYFDYNATSPLSNKVLNFLKSGDFAFGNPSSLHNEGKLSKKKITQTSNYLFELFSINSNQFEIIYHSGASEGINAFLKGVALTAIKQKKKLCFCFSSIDHPCVLNSKETLELLGHRVEIFGVNSRGEFDKNHLIDLILKQKELGYVPILNFTIVNNETGVHWPLTLAEEIKIKTDAIIHVDAVQLVGKIAQWRELSSNIDCYTFSAHKFGALKGIGFSFLIKNIDLLPFINGGNQQYGRRAGTENITGIESIKLALEDLNSSFSADELFESKMLIEKTIENLISGRGEIIAKLSTHRNLNTIFLIIKNIKAETLQMKFDLAGMAVSTGSACSSGIIQENKVLMNMGFSSEDSRSSLRLSFSPKMNKQDAILYCEKISQVLSELMK